MTHVMNLNPEPFLSVKNGYKFIELRLYDKKRQSICIGDEIQFLCEAFPKEVLTKEVVYLHRFENFEELYRELPLLKCGYTPFTLLSANPEDMEFYYTKEQQKKCGVVGIELKEEPLQRFLAGQSGLLPDCSGYEKALYEIKSGKKTTHWIWYILPQIQGLSSDPVTEYYALRNLSEANEFLQHPVLGVHLKEICKELLRLDCCDIMQVLGRIDSFKLRSCMTLFDKISSNESIFSEVLERYCTGTRDEETLNILK